MNNLAEKVWIVPTAAVLLSVVSLTTLATRGLLVFHDSSIAREVCEIAFWTTPLAGIATLLVISSYRVFGSIDTKTRGIKRAVRLAVLAAFSPARLLALQIVWFCSLIFERNRR